MYHDYHTISMHYKSYNTDVNLNKQHSIRQILGGKKVFLINQDLWYLK